MKEKKDYYELLKVSRTATQEEIKDAFKQQAKKLHPDVNKAPNATEQFQELNHAYSVLSDPSKRRMYDATGQDDQYGSNRQQYGGQSPFGQGFDFSKIFQGGQSGFSRDSIFKMFAEGMGGEEDVFKTIFGGSQKGQSSQEFTQTRINPHIEKEVTISFKEVLYGVKKQIENEVIAPCKLCQGRGYDSLTNVDKCAVCAGHGVVRQTTGIFTFEQTCPRCRGNGMIIKKHCKKCNGKCFIKSHEKINIKVPKGIDEQHTMNYQGYGNYVKPNLRGTLFVKFRIVPHRVFIRKGSDLVLNVPVNYYDAILGTSLVIPLIDGGTTKIKIPSNTKNNKIYRLVKKGLPHVNSANSFGDLLVNIKVVYPQKLAKQEKALLEKIKKQDTSNFYNNWLKEQMDNL